MYNVKKCDEKDIWRIRGFLVDNFKKFNGEVNWHIERLNFSYSMSRCINGVSEEEYRNRIQIFEENKEIIAVVNTEGENRGEAFFQISKYDIDDDMLDNMFEFVKNNLMIEKDDKKIVFLRINRTADKIVKKAIVEGFKKEKYSEITSKLVLNGFKDVTLPKGYKIVDSKLLSFKKRAIGHSKGFGYFEKKDVLERSEKGLEELANMQDFNYEYDINIVPLFVDENNEIVAFCTMWHDEKNKIGILEPVGTHSDHRRKGLAKAAIYHACNLMFEKKVEAIYVGSDQEFYKAIDFEEAIYNDIYSYTKRV